MPDYKIFIGILVVVLTFVAYVPYIRDIFNNKTTPHTFTYFVWTLATAITFALQVSKGAGSGAWVTFAVAAICFFIFLLGLYKKNYDITTSDLVFLVLSLVALVVWLGARQPVASVMLIVMVDVFGFVPTV